jgi:FtsP/CotA-like multicopper oxidase with cupredoxin domain
MNRLFQFLRKLLIAALAGVFISIGTFPGKVTAAQTQPPDTPSTEVVTPSTIEPPTEEDLLQLPTGGALGAERNTCPIPPDWQPPDFIDPRFEKSKYGELDITLSAVQNEFNVGNQSFKGVLYKLNHEEKGLYIPPTLKVWPGNSINLLLQNEFQRNLQQQHIEVSQDTNLHYHGFNVSPLLGSDDVVMHVHPKDNYQMHVDIPSTHQSGLFWYHPHVHTTSEFQVLGGMSGGIIIEGIEKYYPILKGIPILLTGKVTSPLIQRVMLFKDFQGGIEDIVKPPKERPFNCFTLNGLVQPKITIKQGEVQFWRIANIGADTYLNLSLLKLYKDNDSHTEKSAPMEMYILARDGNIVTKPIRKKLILLPPASRVELLVIGGQDVGKEQTYKLVSLPPDGDESTECIFKSDNPEVATNCYELATVAVSGAIKYDTQEKSLPDYITSQTPTELDPSRPSPDELAQLYIPNNHKRTFTFSAKDQGKAFLINDEVYDENRIDTTVQVGDIEEWTLLNVTPGHHAFHIHQLDFLDMTNYDPKNPPLGYQDTIDIPPCEVEDPRAKQKQCKKDPTGKVDKPGKTVVRIPFTNPVITGVFVYHCHILGHEDKGMMQNIKVINPPLAAPIRDVF